MSYTIAYAEDQALVSPVELSAIDKAIYYTFWANYA